jgi:DNA-binding NtrC family response regulator
MHRGFEIVCVKSPQKGMALFQAHPSKIDLVAIDLATQAVGNLDLAAELERLRPGLPILYLVGAQKLIARCSIEASSPGAVLPAPFTEEQLIERVGGLLSIEVAARRAPEEKLWERLIAVSNPIRSGAAILHIYERRQTALAADHAAMPRAGNIHYCVRPTNCEMAPYGLMVQSKDVAGARSLLTRASVGRELVSAA